MMDEDLKKALEESRKDADLQNFGIEEENQYPPGVKQVSYFYIIGINNVIR